MRITTGHFVAWTSLRSAGVRGVKPQREISIMSECEEEIKGKKDRRIDVGLQVGTALLAFIGAFGGNLLATTISGKQNEKLWLREDVSEQRSTILTQRIALIERVSRVLNSRYHVRDINSYIEIQASLAKDIDTCSQNPKAFGISNTLDCMKISNTEGAFNKLEKLTNINAEFSATMQVAALFFSSKTENAIQELLKQPAWWAADEKYYKDILGAMQDEMYQLKYRLDEPTVEVHGLTKVSN